MEPHIVLLDTVKRDALGWDRVKRDAASSSNATTTSSTSDPSSLTRGYAQSEDFLKDVDITEENINSTIKNHNLSISDVSNG